MRTICLQAGPLVQRITPHMHTHILYSTQFLCVSFSPSLRSSYVPQACFLTASEEPLLSKVPQEL